jgi:hypothetical protein
MQMTAGVHEGDWSKINARYETAIVDPYDSDLIWLVSERDNAYQNVKIFNFTMNNITAFINDKIAPHVGGQVAGQSIYVKITYSLYSFSH